VFQKIGMAVVLLLCAINCFVIYSSKAGSGSIGGFLPVILGIFFAFLGNLMHSIKPNYFAGIRTPWTLESEETWRKTHQLGGKLWFAGGLVLAVSGLLFPLATMKIVMPVVIAILVIWPIAYSYLYYKSIEKKIK
ncbi:MAG: SdpI family protein, partial [Bacteroidota bacterium]|nr:SdpI family protein [Bacteroidota bacterium]